jgi:hypothetical protein
MPDRSRQLLRDDGVMPALTESGALTTARLGDAIEANQWSVNAQPGR